MTIKELVEKYHSNRASFLKASYNETLLRSDFLDPLFELLGWDIKNSASKPTNEREVILEEALKANDDFVWMDHICYVSQNAALIFKESSSNPMGASCDTRLDLNGCHFFSCPGYMWGGMQLQIQNSASHLAKIKVEGNTLIEDAGVSTGLGGICLFNGTTTPGGGTTVNPTVLMPFSSTDNIILSDGAVFNKNYNGIGIINYSPSPTSVPYPFRIVNTVFTSRNFGCFADAAGSTGTPADYYPFSWPGTDIANPQSLKYPVSGTPDGYTVPFENLGASSLYPPVSTNSSISNPCGIALLAVGRTVVNTSGNSFYGIAVGDPSTSLLAYNQNVFELKNGIYTSTGANLEVYNSVFTKCGNGINANSSQVSNMYPSGSYVIPSFYNQLKVLGNNDGVTGNVFYDNGVGVSAIGYYDVTGQYATMSARTTGALSDYPHNSSLDNANMQCGYSIVSGSTDIYGSVEIANNTIYSNAFGIHIKASASGTAPSTTSQGNINIHDNQLWGAGCYSGGTLGHCDLPLPNNEYMEWGIYIRDLKTTSPAATNSNTVSVKNNTIYNAYNGIAVCKFKDLPVVISNNLEIRLTKNLNTTKKQMGILDSGNVGAFAGSGNYGVDISQNSIRANEYNTPVPTSVPSGSPDFVTSSQDILEGIRTVATGSSSNKNNIHCNNVSHINVGFDFSNTNYLDWTYNYLEQDMFGLALTNNGTIGTQGSSGATIDNQWAGTWPSTGYHTYVVSGSPCSSILYVRNNSGSIPPFYTPTLNGAIPGSVNYNTTSCTALNIITGLTTTSPCYPGTAAKSSGEEGVTSIDANNQQYNLHPNPNDGNITVSQMAQDENPVSIKVWNMMGQTIYNSPVIFGQKDVLLNLKGIASGVYLMEITDSHGRKFNHKFVVDK